MILYLLGSAAIVALMAFSMLYLVAQVWRLVKRDVCDVGERNASAGDGSAG